MAAIRDFGIDPVTGDLATANGDFTVVADAAAIPQGIRCRVRLFIGEYWLDQTKGVRWIELIFIKNPNPVVVREELRSNIAETPDVTDVAGVNPTISSDRSASISFTAATTYSTSPSVGEVEV